MTVFQSQAKGVHMHRNVQRQQVRGEQAMAQTAGGKPVQITTRPFLSGYAHAVHGATSHRMPSETQEETVAGIVERIL